ncbi:hypothetical protein [Streptosporangium saharense]|uniref:hypothetical protein n=1 Tax=Streptosporangium saharense TaxID=1706840 RepID=UPI00332F313A
MSPFDAVLCDFDGVLRVHDARVQARIDHEYGLAPGSVLATALSPALIGPAVLGEITFEEWEAALVAEFTGLLGSPELAAARAGAAPGRCLFVDDRRENVEAATSLGMTGVHFREAEDLRRVWAEAGWE